MYSHFAVEGFRGLGPLELPLTPVTVLTGKNSVGKSSVLEALFLHACGVHAPLNAVQVLRPMRALPTISVNDGDEMNDPWLTFFESGAGRRPLHLRAVVDGDDWNLTLERRTSSVRSMTIGASGTASSTGAALDVTLDGSQLAEPEHSRVFVHLDPTGQSLTWRQEPPTLRSVIEEVRIVKDVGAVNVVEAFSALRLQGGDTAVVTALAAVDPRITGLELLVSEGAPRLHARLRGEGLLPLAWLGGGVNRALTYLLAASTARGGLLLIDEIENGLHHSVLAAMWDHLIRSTREAGTQLVVATHSDEAIRAAAEAMAEHLDDLSLVRLRDARDDDGGWGASDGAPVAVVTYPGPRVADAVDLAVEVR